VFSSDRCFFENLVLIAAPFSPIAGTRPNDGACPSRTAGVATSLNAPLLSARGFSPLY